MQSDSGPCANNKTEKITIMVSHHRIAGMLTSDPSGFVLLWMLIWILSIALVISGCHIYYRYKEKKKSGKRKKEEAKAPEHHPPEQKIQQE